jgi:hypothetical protein
MTTRRFFEQDEPVDGTLGAAFAELRQDVPQDVDWQALHAAINQRAELVLARRRRRYTISVPRPLIPLAAAASIALALWTGPTLMARFLNQGAAEVATTSDTDDILRQAFGDDLTDQEFNLLVTGRANPEALLAVAVGGR